MLNVEPCGEFVQRVACKIPTSEPDALHPQHLLYLINLRDEQALPPTSLFESYYEPETTKKQTTQVGALSSLSAIPGGEGCKCFYFSTVHIFFAHFGNCP